MELLKQVNPQEWKSIPPLALLYRDLASNPYCSNEKGYCHIRTKKHAIKHAYIQPNHPAVCKWLVFDIDSPDALFAYYDNGLPPPQIIIENSENGHSHYAFKLTNAVGIGGRSSMKAVRYLSSVQKALGEALGADSGYSGNLIKNPCHHKHNTYITKGTQPSYTLAELASYLDLEPLYSDKAQISANDIGYGRNCTLFDELRPFGYKYTVKNFKALIRHLTPISENINNRFDVPLLPNEVKHIVRSIARYCSRMDFTASHKAFTKLQAVRGAKGGKASNSSGGGKARSAKYSPKRQQAEQMHRQGINKSEIARNLDVSRRTVINWLG